MNVKLRERFNYPRNWEQSLIREMPPPVGDREAPQIKSMNGGNPLKKLYVGNLNFDTTEDALRSLFETYGSVERVSVITDRETGRSRGFAFVEMSDAGGAERAIAALNGTKLGGRMLNVNEARPKLDRGPSRYDGGASREDYRGAARQPREPRW